MKIEISNTEIIQRVKTLFKDDYRDEVMEVIEEVFKDNEHALSILFKLSLGIKPVLNYKEKDDVLIKPYDLQSWKFDKQLTEKSEFAYKGLIICKVVKVNKYAKECYDITYKALKNDNEVIVINQSVSEEIVIALHENAENIAVDDLF
jgi:hypothetical protein